ncbi:MAG: CidA/LrgA family protein [Betaproteobacteria bacterium]|nr:CidA/LrgA family protein [Betaproteobacteria bacterium]
MSVLRQCVIIFLCLAFGELIVNLTETKFPSSLIGMLLLAFLLKTGWIKLEWVKGISDFLLAHFGLFFVPPGVALMLYFDLIAAELLPITLATIISTLAVLTVTGWTYQLFRRQK